VTVCAATISKSGAASSPRRAALLIQDMTCFRQSRVPTRYLGGNWRNRKPNGGEKNGRDNVLSQVRDGNGAFRPSALWLLTWATKRRLVNLEHVESGPRSIVWKVHPVLHDVQEPLANILHVEEYRNGNHGLGLLLMGSLD